VGERQAAVAECEEEEQQVPDTQEVWRRLSPLLSSAKRSGRPYSQERRLVLEAIVQVMQTDCGWQALPSHFPPWKTVYAQYRQWRKAGIWDKIWVKPTQRCSKNELQL
jgi:transposase